MRTAWSMVAAMVVCAWAGVAPAAPIITVGTFQLQENTPNQTIQLTVSGGDAVEGLNLYVATGDGGSLLGGTDGSAPAITAVDIVGPTTIFGSSNTGQTTPDQTAQFWSAYTTTDVSASDTVPADGILASLTIDTTGFFHDAVTPANNLHALSLDFTGSLGIATDFAGVPATISNGQIQIVPVPEPSAAGLLMTAIGGLLLLRRRD